ASVRVIRCQLPVHPVQFENTIDLAGQMIRWHHLVEIKRIKELTLPVFPSTHHAPLPQMSALKERNHGSRVVSIGVLQHNRENSGHDLTARECRLVTRSRPQRPS